MFSCIACGEPTLMFTESVKTKLNGIAKHKGMGQLDFHALSKLVCFIDATAKAFQTKFKINLINLSIPFQASISLYAAVFESIFFTEKPSDKFRHIFGSFFHFYISYNLWNSS